MAQNTILYYIRDYAFSRPDTLAVCESRGAVTYSQYWDSIRRTAAVLADLGVEKGTHVVIRCTQNIEYLTQFTALQLLGAIPIPIEKATSLERVGEIAAAVDAGLVISREAPEGVRLLKPAEITKAAAEAKLREFSLARAEERSMILFTTGTTGASKGVVVLHRNDVAIAENIIQGTGMCAGNVELIPMPLNHAFGLRRYQADIVNGGTVCLMDGMVFVGVLYNLIDKYGVTSMALSPATLGLIFKLSGDRISEYSNRLDFIQIGSAPLMEADKQTLLRLLPQTRLYNFYGSSEAGCSCILNFNSEDNKPGCIGRPTVNSWIRFTDADGNVVENGSPEEPALLSWGGPIVMDCYYNAPELTAETVIDGYVRTKDLAYLDAEGRCILVGRADDVINYGGSKISPAEIEDCARAYDKIADCAYTAKNDPIAGDFPVIVIVKKEGYDEGEFEAFLSERLERYKMPKEYFYVDSLPKTFKGSLLRKDIRKLVSEMSSAN